MAKRKEELTEKLLDGVLDNTTSIKDEPIVLPAANTIPDINSSDWTPFLLSKMTPDELWDGCPTLEGLRRITPLYVGEVLESVSQVHQAPNVGNGNHSCVSHHLTVSCHPDEDAPYLGRLAGQHIRYGGTADVFLGNGTDSLFSWQHSSATCESRAESRAYKRLLRLRHVLVREELSEVSKDNSGAEGYIIQSQIMCLDMMCSKNRLNINAEKYLVGVWRNKSPNDKHDDLNNIPYSVAGKAIAMLMPWQQDRSKIKPEVVGYVSGWTKQFKCLAE